MKSTTAEFALNQALLAVGIKAQKAPRFYLARDYTPSEKRSIALDVVIKEDGVDVYEYSTDVREPPLTLRSFKSLRLFVRSFVVEQIEHAATVHMATAQRHTLDSVKAGNPEEFFKARKEYALGLVARLENFPRSDAFSRSIGEVNAERPSQGYRNSAKATPSLDCHRVRSLGDLWEMQKAVSPFGNLVASIFSVLLGSVLIYMANHDMVKPGWRQVEHLHAIAIAGYWVVAVVCFLMAACAMFIAIQALFRK